ncbi:MAG: toll/interleukin-1 receptor domain-containing protein [Chloroflexota bacterium]
MSSYNNAQIRKWLQAFFGDEEDFDFFTEDNFAEVFETFTLDTSFNKKTRLLAKYCEEHNLYSKLIELVQNEDPDKFEEIAPPEPSEDAEESAPAPVQSEVVTTSESAPEPSPPAPAVEVDAGPTKDNDIFISYSRRDLTFVTGLHQYLTNQGISAWFDQENIELGDHWRTSIVEGIRNCKIFVLVLSPDSTASVNVRKEVDLAERHNKQIVPVMWRMTDIPVGMEYQLAGIQYIDFNETASDENLIELTTVVQRLIGGSTLNEATSTITNVVASTITDIPKETEEPATSTGRQLGGGRRLGSKKRSQLSPIAIGGLVISSVVTTFGLGQEDQDYVNEELKWLFYAAEHTLKINQGVVDASEPIPLAIPPNATELSGSKGGVITSPSHAVTQSRLIEQVFDRIQKHLKILARSLSREADLGEQAVNDTMLMAEIRGNRKSIVEDLKLLADGMAQAYEIRINSPNDLLEFLEEG